MRLILGIIIIFLFSACSTYNNVKHYSIETKEFGTIMPTVVVLEDDMYFLGEYEVTCMNEILYYTGRVLSPVITAKTQKMVKCKMALIKTKDE